MPEATQRSWFGRMVDLVRDGLAKTGIGTFSRRVVKIGIVAAGVIIVLAVALSLSRRVEPTVDHVLGSVAPMSDRMADIGARLAHIEAANQEILNAVLDTCRAPAKKTAAQKPPVPVKRAATVPQPEPTFFEKLFGATSPTNTRE